MRYRENRRLLAARFGRLLLHPQFLPLLLAQLFAAACPCRSVLLDGTNIFSFAFAVARGRTGVGRCC